MTFNLKSAISVLVFCFYLTEAVCQTQPFIKTGINFGFINKEYWEGSGSSDQFRYGKPLIRPILAIGLKHDINKFTLGAAIMYQTKGQGSKVPRVRNFFQSISPDVLHFMSCPVSLEYNFLKKLGVTLSIQPSMYLGGVDNYYASEYWRGWIWNAVIGLEYSLSKKIEIGFEYDHDLNLYYCPECDVRFFTYRLYTSFPIGSISGDYARNSNKLKK